ncbi:UDP-N-acetylmuramate dehydrogenase [soil metagenome]
MQVQQNVSLKAYNSFAINAIAKEFAMFTSTDQLQELLTNYQLQTTNQKLLILGGGSNILFTKNFEGLVLKNELKGIQLIKEDDEYYYVKANAGENWHAFVLYCIANNYAGIENLSLIPGNIGATPIQNIGAYGVEIKDVFYELEAYHLKEHIIQKFSIEECAFGYRESIFKGKYKDQLVILNVTYRLRKQPVYNTSYGAIEQELEKMGIKEISIKAISDAVINIRSSKLPDPKVIGNAGSFFKNPTISKYQFETLKENYNTIPGYPVNDVSVKVAAGWLIEQCGWKGYRRGDAGCHAKQALVLVNYGNANGDEIYSLAERIIESVKNKFDIQLEKEVNIIM